MVELLDVAWSRLASGPQGQSLENCILQESHGEIVGCHAEQQGLEPPAASAATRSV